MGSRFRLPDPPVTVSDDAVMDIDSSSSAAISQPVKEAGRGAASRDGVMTNSNTHLVAANATKASKRSSKRARNSGADVVIDDDDSDDDSEKAGDASSPSSDSASMSSSSSAPIASRTGGSSASLSASDTPASLAGSSSPSTHILSAGEYVPVYVGHDKLRSQANIDNRCRDAVHVQFQIDARHPSCPVIDPLHYKYNGAAKQRFVATFLGSTNGLCINSPIIPRFLAEQPMTGPTAASPQLSGPQREWLMELREQMADNYDLIHDRNTSDDNKMDACERLWGHLGKLDATGQHPALWEPDQLTSEWKHLLAPRTASWPATPLASSQRQHQHRILVDW
jgi:hypothetical protein